MHLCPYYIHREVLSLVQRCYNRFVVEMSIIQLQGLAQHLRTEILKDEKAKCFTTMLFSGNNFQVGEPVGG